MDDDMGKRRLRALIAISVLSLYFSLHLATLARHPFVHSDEAWLTVLTRAMAINRSPAATEEVFRLTSRHPHALKTLFHLIQMPFLAVSWSAFAARLPSLIAGAASLAFMARIAGAWGLKGWRRYAPSMLMAADPQFWYVSHLARQEILLIALFLWAWSLQARRKPAPAAALPLAAGIFVHPNAFILSLGIGALYAADAAGNIGKRKAGKSSARNLAAFAAVLAAAAIGAVGASLLMDGDFFAHYASFGRSVGAGDSLAMKFLGLPRFLGKMWNRRAGTYYLADVRPMFVFGAAGYSLNAVRALRMKSGRERLLVLPAVLAGMVVVGKFAPPTVSFLMPPAYLAIGEAMFGKRLKGMRSPGGGAGRRRERAVAAAVFATFGLLATISAGEVVSSLKRPGYREYVRFLEESTGPLENGERVLGNLNAAFAFEYDEMAIWRDLGALEEGKGLENALDELGVAWILVPDELEYIHSRRPVWNGLYGNPRWYPDLVDLLERRGTEVARGSFPDYAMRIVPYMDSGDWSVRVFRLDE